MSCPCFSCHYTIAYQFECLFVSIRDAHLTFLNDLYMKWAGHLTSRSDVYSFGVVLLELLTGRRSFDKTRPSKEQNLVDWARPKLNDKRKLLQIIDHRLENQYSVRAAQKACSLAYYCLSQNPKARPLMSDVVETLEPLQSSNDASEISSSSLSSCRGAGSYARSTIPDYRMRHKFTNNVGPGASCRSPNPNCSPGASAACRVRWELVIVIYTPLACFSFPLFKLTRFTRHIACMPCNLCTWFCCSQILCWLFSMTWFLDLFFDHSRLTYNTFKAVKDLTILGLKYCWW